MNIQAFQKDLEETEDRHFATRAAGNIINREQDRLSGRRPIEFIQATRPVVVIDEPQNMESDGCRGDLRLNPFCTLRYSATHKNGLQPHLSSGTHRRLRPEPRQAHRGRECSWQTTTPTPPSCDLVAVDDKGSAHKFDQPWHGLARSNRRSLGKRGDDLAVLSEIAKSTRTAGSSPTSRSDRGRGDGVHQRVVECHSGAQSALRRRRPPRRRSRDRRAASRQGKDARGLGVKVLSLFFIDKVANYRGVDDEGNPTLGPIGDGSRRRTRNWHEASLRRLSSASVVDKSTVATSVSTTSGAQGHPRR